MRKSNKKLLSLLLSGVLAITAISPVYATEIVNIDSEIESVEMQDSVLEEILVEEPDIESDLASEELTGEESSSYQIEVNQGFSIHTSKDAKEDSPETYLKDFVAKKATAIMVRLKAEDEAAAKTETESWEIQVVAANNGEESGSAELSANKDNFNYKQFYDKDSDVCKNMMLVVDFPTGPEKGTYNVKIKSGDSVVATETGFNFYETTPLNILAVPVTAYYSMSANVEGGGCPADKINQGVECDSSLWDGVKNDLGTYLKDVYPIADINIEYGEALNGGSSEYDMCTSEGQKKLWEEANKLMTKDKDSGKDKYDIILAFVMYRQDANGCGQGYTFGKPTNIITLTDKDMLPTVAHEIAHCYQVGDEYDGGSFNSNVNIPPKGYEGKVFGTGEDLPTEDKKTPTDISSYWQTPKEYKASLADDNAKKAKIQEEGAGTIVFPSLHPYILSKSQFVKFATEGEEVRPTISYMGSGYKGSEDLYFSTSVIWDHLLKQFLVKEKKEEQSSEEQPSEEQPDQESNLSVYMSSVAQGTNGDTLDLDDFYFDDDYREGDSRMVEVSGEIKYESNAADAAVKSVDLDPMFSYDGDLSYIEQDDAKEHGNKGMFIFAALDKDGNIIKSPVDGQSAIVEFYAGNFNSYQNAPVSGNAIDKRFQDFGTFSFDAEYPEGTAKFVIFKADGWDKKSDKPGTPIKEGSIDVPATTPQGGIVYANVEKNNVKIQWTVENVAEGVEPNKNNLYTRVYYAPQGDNGELVYIKDGSEAEKTAENPNPDSFNVKDTNWSEISFNPADYGGWTSDAYVWIMTSDGVNGLDMYSDEDQMTIGTADIIVKGAVVNNVVTYDYTGEEIIPAVAVKVTDKETGKIIKLKEGLDYTVKYSNNINAGEASVKVTGIGEYTGSKTEFFDIAPASLTKAKIEDVEDVIFDATIDTSVSPNNKKPNMQLEVENSMSVVLGNTVLECGKDYTVKYIVGDSDKEVEMLPTVSSNEVIPVEVTVKGKGNYAGKVKKTATFEILPDNEENRSRNFTLLAKKGELTIELASDAIAYNGKALKPKVKAVYAGKDDAKVKLSKSVYKVSYKKNVNPGVASVVIVGKKGYSGKATTNFTITKMAIKKLNVKAANSIFFTGVSQNTVPVFVKVGKLVLKEGVDYTVSYNGVLDKATTKEMKKNGEAPSYEIKLLANSPRFEWADSVAESKRVFSKNYIIKKGRFNSNSLINAVIDSMTIKDSEEKTVTMLFSKNSEKKLFKNYAYIVNEESGQVGVDINGETASVSMNVIQKGKTLDKSQYKVTVTSTKIGKVGKIIIEPTDTVNYSGKRIIKFMNAKIEE